MQSVILIALMLVVSMFIVSEFNRNNITSRDNYLRFKAENVAANIIQYNDLLMRYSISNYDTLHHVLSFSPGNIESITLINYDVDKIADYTQKNLQPFFNYQVVTFNFSPNNGGDGQPLAVLYLATSWDSYIPGIVGYSNTSIEEGLGRVGQYFGKHLYQGTNTYWSVPWVLKQANCNIIELYTNLPKDATSTSMLDNVKVVFNDWCNQVEKNSSYKFLTYVYLQPVYK